MAQQRNWETDPVDIDYLLDSGLLFRINRDFLHLFGIAMTVKVDEQGSKRWDFKDCRNNPGDLLFSPEVFNVSKSKFDKFMANFGNEQMERRRDVLGSASQERADCQRRRAKGVASGQGQD